MAKRSFTRFVEQEWGKLPHFLICAVLECFVIILLMVNGSIAFFADRFAWFFELRIPCLLCSRIDHVLMRRKADFYYNHSMCESHKRDISSLAYCHNHKKLSDIRKMCEACLLSFATEKESDCATYKSLVGILHKDVECFVEDDHQILSLLAGRKDDSILVEKSDGSRCSCCGEQLKVKSFHSRGKQIHAFSQAPAPSPRGAFVPSRNEDHRNMELPHIQYTELKPRTDNDTELPEDGDRSHERNQFKEDTKSAAVSLLPETEDWNEETNRTPNFIRGNKFFGIPLSDSPISSPRLAIRISRKSPLERAEFAPETGEVNVPDDGDGDSILYSLKRQVRIDRKSLMALYMELDEERSASAVAANNAMAMITRLQAEKAAVQMEALQYQRLMDEQAEYDQEALQATNDLLMKREEDIKGLEAELEAFRTRYGPIREGDLIPITEDIKRYDNESEEDYQEFKSRSYPASRGDSDSGSSPSYSAEKGNDAENQNRDHRVETGIEKIEQVAQDIIKRHQKSRSYSAEKGSDEENENRDHQVAAGTEKLEQVAQDIISKHQPTSSKGKNDGGFLNELVKDFKGHRTYLLGRMKKVDNKGRKKSDVTVNSLQDSSGGVKDTGDAIGEDIKTSLTAELCRLNERLKALEADSGFLEPAAEELRKHSEGTQILKDVSKNLMKLQQLVTVPLEDHNE